MVDLATVIKKQNREGIHNNHRKRLKEKFRATGLAGFHDHNVLEMLLFYAIPRCDTNEFAHLLINEFGSFNAVFDAPIEALTKVDGIGIEAATLIKFIPELFRYYEAGKVKNMKNITSSDDAVKFLSPFFTTKKEEIFVVVYLDGRGGVIKTTEISQGADDMVKTDFSIIIKQAVILEAKGILISHNHPSGFAVPSQEDKLLTEKLCSLCNPLGITLCDHIIFSEDDIFCMSKGRNSKNLIFAF